MRRLDRLDRDHVVRLDAIRQEWLGIGTSIAPTDRAQTEAGIIGLYHLLDASPPEFVWTESPAQAAAEIVAGSSRRSLQPANMMWRELSQQRGELTRKLSRWLDYRLESRTRFDVTLRLGVDVWSRFWHPVREAFVELVGNRPTLLPRFGGQQDAMWIASYRAFEEITGVPYLPAHRSELDLWTQVANSCGFCWCFRGVVVVSDRPESLHSEDGQRLHRDGGPAIRFRDGWSVWARNGIFVPPPDDITADRILQEHNAQRRQLLIESYGQERFLTEIGFSKVRSDDWGTIFVRTRSDREPIVYVRVVNATFPYEDFFLRVPPEYADRSPHAAVAWTFGFEDRPSDYSPTKQT